MTISNVINFGSAMQTYATIKTVEKLGCNCVLIDYAYPSSWHSDNAMGFENAKKRPVPVLRRLLKNCLKKLYLLDFVRMIRRIVKPVPEQTGLNEFRCFLRKLPVTPCVYNRKSILKNPPVFDIYMTGSDQTWNPRYLHTDYSFLLNFAPENAPRIAYSASFGAKKMLPEYRTDYIRLLKKYDRISVREPSGVDLVRELTGKTALHVSDPTLMLDRNEWCCVHQKQLDLPEKFIFCYILTYVFNPFPQINKLIKHLSEISGLPVVVFRDGVELVDIKCRELSTDIGPEGFIECFDRADFVITTSFHGAAFSVNFEKDFFAVLNPNPSIDDRVKSFLQTVRLEDRGLDLTQTDVSAIRREDMKTDHSASVPEIRKMRERAVDFLTEAIDSASKKMRGEEK